MQHKKGDKSDENNDVEHLQAHAANAEEGLFLLEFDTQHIKSPFILEPCKS